MKNPRIVPKKFPFTPDDITAMKKVEVYLRSWIQKIDEQLFREGYELRNGVLYEIKTNTPVQPEEYQKRQKHH